MNMIMKKKNMKYNSLDEYGHYINIEYSNVHFVFEIHYTRDDYIFLKKQFFNESDFSQVQITLKYFQSYFKSHPTHRILFLMMLTGFIRYEYLNDENRSNFFSNFLINCLHNEITNTQTFRNSLVNYFFRFMGDIRFETQGLYLYGTQTDKVRLKLEEAGSHKFLNSFILHAGGISEKDLPTYMQIIRFLSEDQFVATLSNHELYTLYTGYSHYRNNNRLKKFFEFLLSESEVSNFVKNIIIKSIDCYHHLCNSAFINSEFTFELPRFIKNYLLFTGKYGVELEKYKINISNIYYENQNLFFTPKYAAVFSNMQDIYFQVNGKKITINKSRDLFIKDDFVNCKILLEYPEQTQQIDLYVDGHLYKRYEFNLYKYGFVLLNSNYAVKKIDQDIIEVAVDEEDNYLYMLSREILDYDLEDEFYINYKEFFLYKIKVDRTLSNLNIGNKIYTIHYQPKFTVDYLYKNDEGYEYFGVLPQFIALPERDQDSFIAMDQLNDVELTYQEYLNYAEVIGKFDISIGIHKKHNFKVIYINGFEIKKWFRWYDMDKTVEILVTTDKIKTNSLKEIKENNKVVHIFDLKGEKNNILFNTIDGKQVTLPIIKPDIKFFFIDKRKQKYPIKSKNIHLDTLSNYRKLMIELINFPTSIKFTHVKINGKEINVKKVENKYYISIKELKEMCSENIASQYALKLVGSNNYYLLFNFIFFYFVQCNMIDCESVYRGFC